MIKLNATTVEIIVGLHVYFDNEYDKICLWIRTKNLNLGGLSPMQLIEMGKEKKLLQFINDAIDENRKLK